MTQADRDQMYGWGYTKADIQRIENEDADKRDEARYMADDNDDNGDDAGDEE